MRDGLRPRLHRMTAERAAELRGYVAIERRVLDEARDREALRMRGADSNTWLSNSVYAIADPLLQRSR